MACQPDVFPTSLLQACLHSCVNDQQRNGCVPEHGKTDVPTAYGAADGNVRYLQETISQSQTAYDSTFGG